MRIEFTTDIEEHIPIRVIAEGRDLDSLLENAEYCVDCPDPKNYYPIDHLSVRSWNSVSELISAEVSDHQERAAEIRAERIAEGRAELPEPTKGGA